MSDSKLETLEYTGPDCVWVDPETKDNKELTAGGRIAVAADLAAYMLTNAPHVWKRPEPLARAKKEQ